MPTFKFKFPLILLVLTTALVHPLAHAQKVVRSLSQQKWTFKIGASDIAFKAKVPGCQYTDLLANKMIEHPFVGNNEAHLQDIAKFPVTYETTFLIQEKELNATNILLRLNGLDTYAKVYLNDQLILSAYNMHRSWACEVKHLLKIGVNHLRVRFEPITDMIKALEKTVPYTLPGGEYVWVRKAAYQFGWDWAPRFLTAGIWKDVELVFETENAIENYQFKVAQLSDSLAKLSYTINLKSPARNELHVSLSIKGLNQVAFVKIDSGQQRVAVNFEVKNPRLWWCNGMGEPYLYQASIRLLKHHTVLDQTHTSFGIRTLQWKQDGNGFYLSLNGYPVFMKGANWVPLHSFLSEVTTEQYRYQLHMAAKANVNMLRVWGGGIYASDYFYQQCDALGILVWQDFMFACAMYPGDSAFLENVSKEVSEQIVRLRNHPSLALWCGNNESSEGWHNWGWQKQFGYSSRDSTVVWQHYQKLFHELIPTLCQQLDEERFYHPSSPANGWGREVAYQTGDVHYWGVWWGNEPFSMYNQKVGRFVSEYGFQGFPSTTMLKKWVPSVQWHQDSLGFKQHQKHPRGFELIRGQMQMQGVRPSDNLDTFARQSANLQALGLEIAIDAHRRNMPYCMGSLFWQWNDCWPAISWSVLDFESAPKPAYDAVREAFKPIRQQVYVKDSLWQYGVVYDYHDTIEVKLIYEVLNKQGSLIDNGTKAIKLSWGFNPSKEFESNLKFILGQPNAYLLKLNLYKGKDLVDQRMYAIKRGKFTSLFAQ